MRNFQRSILLFALSVCLSACKSNKQDAKVSPEQSVATNLTFLDAQAAGQKIIVDNTDGFFDFLSIADMSIQMKKSDMPVSGGESKVLYQQMLQSEMSDFAPEERAFMQEVFIECKAALDKINPALYPSGIELIKTKTNHYGEDVYYTRDRAIVLPENIFKEPSLSSQMPVMLHEIFHIMSRYDDDFRDKMYDLIGFRRFSEELVLPQEMSDKMLTNPDGVRRDYAIHLHNEKGEEVRAVPLIMSIRDRYDPKIPVFFGYLNFDLFPLIQLSPNQVTIGMKNDGESSLSIEHNADFFKKIKDNTQYIIHPDEIMADNFMMAVIANKDETYEGFSEEGTALLKEVIEILKTFKR